MLSGKSVICFLFLFMCVFSINGYGQNTDKKLSKKQAKYFTKEKGKWTVEIPLWLPGFRGDFAYGEVEIEGEDGTIPSPEHPIEKPGFGDVFNRLFKTKFELNYFFLTSIAYKNQRFYAEFDGITGTVGSSLIFRSANHKLVKATAHVDLARLYGGYNVWEEPLFDGNGRYELCTYGGIRLHHFYIKTKINDLGVTLNVEPVWIEPVLGVRNEFLYKRWKFIVQGDMGSFWIDGKYSYMLNVHSHFKLSKTVGLKVGWNSWYVYYKDRFKNEDLRLKTHLAGPVTALTFNF